VVVVVGILILAVVVVVRRMLKMVKDTWKFDHLLPTTIRKKSHSDSILRASLKNIFLFVKSLYVCLKLLICSLC